ncbi:MarR family transcriptional regulator [Streptomyces chiangmaiensis]|uniref:MarR family transcriptional regulator n=1 Tax=Streptomyces chiangmaiensis TaxID=766497 RepID=A0ABU7FDN4_9ACTN|nr:MarR family transcriptional regulator [Streptomyces chiangmaiensis]MED7822061.1 MarR family transcriptional regulator [Streptomyces chiangmaiensis]
MTQPTPVVNGQLIGLTHYASRALLERVLTRTGTTFTQSVILRSLASHGGILERRSLVNFAHDALKIVDESEVRTAVEELVAGQLLATSADDRVSFTDDGRELFDHIQDGGKEVASRLYAGIPQKDLEAAGRVLALVLRRANAELAAA